jgi:N-acetylmuramoyl-L-alanine amidase
MLGLICIIAIFLGKDYINQAPKTSALIIQNGKTTKAGIQCDLNKTTNKKSIKTDNSKYTIVIDPGHQEKQNKELEPIGPGAKTKKPKVSSGTTGRYTKKPEYKVNLEVALKLRDILKKQGYHVVMVRESNKVNISNSERAAIANKRHADVFIRIHCNGSENSAQNGALTMCPTKNNPYCSNIYKKSRKLSDSILAGVCQTTKAKNKGVIETDSMSGINWCKVPVTIVEMGFMTNKQEDYNLSNKKYQEKLARGMANGIQSYLKQVK